MTAKKSDVPDEITIERVHLGSAKIWIKGLSPLIFNCMSAKARHELLFPRGKKTPADRATQLKHDPIDEYRNSVYRRIGNGPTRITFPAPGFKGAMAEAAIEIPGAKKTQIGRLTWVVGDQIDIYGVPKLFMSIVRSSDMARTPDIRTRAIIPEWACCITVRYSTPTLNATNIANLIATAGQLIGVGDFRQGKGKGNYGQFEVSEEKECKSIVESGGLSAQDAALKTPMFYDVESEELYTWFEEERKKRGK